MRIRCADNLITYSLLPFRHEQLRAKVELATFSVAPAGSEEKLFPPSKYRRKTPMENSWWAAQIPWRWRFLDVVLTLPWGCRHHKISTQDRIGTFSPVPNYATMESIEHLLRHWLGYTCQGYVLRTAPDFRHSHELDTLDVLRPRT